VVEKAQKSNTSNIFQNLKSTASGVLGSVLSKFGPGAQEIKAKKFLEERKATTGAPTTSRDLFLSRPVKLPTVGMRPTTRAGISAGTELFAKPFARAAAGGVLSGEVGQRKQLSIPASPFTRSVFGEGIAGEKPGQVLGFQQQIGRVKEGQGFGGQATQFLEKRLGLQPKFTAAPLVVGLGLADLIPENPLKIARGATTATRIASRAKQGLGLAEEAAPFLSKRGLLDFGKRSIDPRKNVLTGLGGAAVGAGTAEEPEDRLGRAFAGGAAGLAGPAAFELGVRGTGAVSRFGAKKTGAALDAAIAKQTQRVGNLTQKLQSFDRTVGDIAKLDRNKKFLSVLETTKRLPVKITSGFFSPAAGLTTSEGILKEVTGKTVDLKDIIERVPSRANALSRKREETFANIISSTKKLDKNTWAKLQDFANSLNKQDRLKLGQVIEGGETQKDVTKKLSDIRLGSTEEEFEVIQALQKEWNTVLRDVLEDAVTAGKISEGQFTNFITAHPNYLPNVVEAFLENPNVFLTSKRGLQTGEFKKAKGSKRALQDSFVSTVDYIRKNTLANEQNKSANELFSKLSDVKLEEFGIRKVETSKKAAALEGAVLKKKPIDLTLEGKDAFKFWKNGEQVTYEVPKEISYALKNLDPEDVAFLKTVVESWPGRVFLKAPANFLRAVATQYNPAFAFLRNPIRDIQTALVNSNVKARDLMWTNVASVANVIAPNSGMAKRYAEALDEASAAGGILGTGFFGRSPSAKSIVSKATGKGNVFSKTLKFVPKKIEDIGGVLEDNTRLAVFVSELRKTKDLTLAAKRSRNATADFSKAGAWTREINKTLPYLNARIRGIDSFAQAIKRDPQGTMRKLMITAAMPAVTLHTLNSRFESFNNIPTWEKRSYWIIMTGELPGQTKTGDRVMIPQYIKIPKGEAQQIGSAIVDRMLEATPTESLPKFITDLASNVSPVALDQGITAFIPQGPKVGIELLANKNFFTGKDIVRDYVPLPPGGKKKTAPREEVPKRFQVDYNTSEVAKALGGILNVSPAELDHVVRKGVMRDIFDAIDIGLGEKEDPFTAPIKDDTLFDLSTIPGTRAFIGSNSYGGALNEKEKTLMEQVEKTEEMIMNILKGGKPSSGSGGITRNPITGKLETGRTGALDSVTTTPTTGKRKIQRNPLTGKLEVK
jgi:hypothetical protein